MDCNIESQLSENGVNPQFLEKSIQAEEIEEEKEKDKEKEWDVKPKFLAPLIDFDELLKELRSNSTEMIDLNRVSKGTQTKTKTKRLTQIKNVAKSNFFITAIVSFVFFVSTTFDVITDGNLTYSFVNGTYYIKRLGSRPDSKLKNVPYLAEYLSSPAQVSFLTSQQLKRQMLEKIGHIMFRAATPW